MFKIFNTDSALLTDAKALADAMAEQRGHVVYVVHICDDDYEITAQVPRQWEYKAEP